MHLHNIKHTKPYYPSRLLGYQGLIGLILYFFCSLVYAWGDLGHEVVMAIAWQNLTPHSKEQINRLLQLDDSHLTEPNPIASATWADKYRNEKNDGHRNHYQETHLWHFIDLDIDNPNLKQACFNFPINTGMASEGPNKDCLLDKINEFSFELKKYHNSNNPSEQKEALLAFKFLVHFMGDLHQPLHASNHKDSGGNRVLINYHHHKMNLHHFWDTEVVDYLGNNPEYIAQQLNSEITDTNRQNWQKGKALDWVKESFNTSKTLIYAPFLKADDARYYDYPEHFSEAMRVAKIQLEEAGIRLAFLLNKDLN